MPDFFVAYSSRNFERVSAILFFLTQEIGPERFWFAPTRSFQTNSVRQTLLGAIEEANAVLSFESVSTYRAVSTRPQNRSRLGQGAQLLLYEREEALRLNKKIVNIAIGRPNKLGLSADDSNTFDLSMSLKSKVARSNLKMLSSYLEDL